LDVTTALNVDLLQVVTVPGEMGQGIVVDVDAALGYEALKFVAPVCKGIDAVAGDHVTPGHINVCQIRTPLGEGVQGDVRDGGATECSDRLWQVRSVIFLQCCKLSPSMELQYWAKVAKDWSPTA